MEKWGEKENFINRKVSSLSFGRRQRIIYHGQTLSAVYLAVSAFRFDSAWTRVRISAKMSTKVFYVLVESGAFMFAAKKMIRDNVSSRLLSHYRNV